MPQLSALTSQLQPLREQRMEAPGIALWVCWQGEAEATVPQTLQDYGGMRLVEEGEQSLWFFFSSDVLLAMTRLESWGRFNSHNIVMQALPATLLIGQSSAEVTLKMDSALLAQNVVVDKGVHAMVHPAVRDEVVGVPGLTFTKASQASGAAKLDWQGISADARMSLQPSLSWYCVLKPLGNPLDKGFQTGWRDFFAELENILKRHKLKYILHDGFLIFPLDSLRIMRNWSREFLQLIRQIREEKPDLYWPCVSGIVERKKLNFNNDLPKKIPLDWDQLVPDLPYMSFRSGYLLGEGFTVHDAGLSSGESTTEDWCTASLQNSDNPNKGLLPVQLAARAVRGTQATCFYCGMRNHHVTECPSKNFEKLSPSTWHELATQDFDHFNMGLKSIEHGLLASGVEFLAEAPKMEGPGGTVLRAMFEINAATQLRMLRRVWLARGREYPRGLDEVLAKDDNPVWEALESIHRTELHVLEKEVNGLIARFPRDYRPRTLLGFIAMERGDASRAYYTWKEAQSYCATPLQQSWCLMLQARALETGGRYQQAGDVYGEVFRQSPLWFDAAYRQAVCLVKQGFAEQAGLRCLQLIRQDPNIFNRILIDPEMERGALHMLYALYEPWFECEQNLEEDKRRLMALRHELSTWFTEEDEFYKKATDRIGQLLDLSAIRNFVPYRSIIQGRISLEKDLQNYVNQKARDLKGLFSSYMERLKYIRDEAAWFPFPSILVEFNRAFNKAAANLNWGLKNQFHTPDAFKQANAVAEAEAKRIDKLERKLKFLRIVRDSTLFLLIMGRMFLFLELTFLILILVVLPLGIYYGEKSGVAWLMGLAGADKWQMQKVIIFSLSIGALAFSILRTVLVFEKKREKLFARARQRKK